MKIAIFLPGVLSLLLASAIMLSGQSAPPPAVKNPPVNVEVMFSNRGTAFQMLVNKKTQSIPRVGFFSVTNLLGEWSSRQVSDHMTQGSLTYELLKGLSLAGGFHLTPATGFRPSAALMYGYSNPNLTFVLNPRTDLTKNGALESLCIVEYKPAIGKVLRAYSRVQGLYVYLPKVDAHARSYLMLRAGLLYKEFNFGLGANLDRYGPSKLQKNSFGGFFSMRLL
jgi:hypothetical protein